MAESSAECFTSTNTRQRQLLFISTRSDFLMQNNWSLLTFPLDSFDKLSNFSPSLLKRRLVCACLRRVILCIQQSSRCAVTKLFLGRKLLKCSILLLMDHAHNTSMLFVILHHFCIISLLSCYIYHTNVISASQSHRRCLIFSSSFVNLSSQLSFYYHPNEISAFIQIKFHQYQLVSTLRQATGDMIYHQCTFLYLS